ncbi:3-keto-disaccharide hydrolase [Flavobacterium sp. 3-210]
MFKKTTLALALLFILNSCMVQRKVLVTEDWYAFTKTNTAQQEPSQVYEFTDGTIRMHGEDPSCLMTKKSYKNFELELEYRWNLDEKYKMKGVKNSGVMYNIPLDASDKIWPKGIQFQIKEKTTGDFIFLDQVTAKVNGKLVEAGASVVSPKFLENENPYGEWNIVVIKSFNGKIKQYLNGKLVNECTEASSTEGKISLNYEHSPIDFRNITIKNISK